MNAAEYTHASITAQLSEEWTRGNASENSAVHILGRGNRTKYHNDRMGTPLWMTNESGNVVWQVRYSAFGELYEEDRDPDGDGTLVENNLRFAGQYDDALFALLLEQGPYYNGARYYSPSIGRYLQVEPAMQNANYVASHGANGVSLNAYGYAANNPLRYVDPTGLEVWLCGAPADLVSGYGFGEDHNWVKTSSQSKGWAPNPSSMGMVNADHSRRQGSCEVVPDVDEACVDATLLSEGMLDWGWIPRVTDCQQFAQYVLNSCGMSIPGVPSTRTLLPPSGRGPGTVESYTCAVHPSNLACRAPGFYPYTW
jgi:RHS repeat-associated protein